MLTITPNNMPTVLRDVLQAGLVPMIHGSPGSSKSDCVTQFAKANNLKLIIITLSTKESVDISGFPAKNEATGRMYYMPLETIPLDGLDKVPKGYSGFCIFFDEFNSAQRSVQASTYRVILDRMVGDYKIHKKAVVICAGNNRSDNAITNDLSTPMQSRLIHLNLIMEHLSWLKWAAQNMIDHRVISFIKSCPALLNNFKPDHDDQTFPCARTWHFLSNYIKPKKTFSSIDLAVMAGTVSEGASTEFKLFCEVYHTLPSMDKILADPANVKFKNEPSVHYALTTLIAANMNEQNIDDLLIVVDRLPIDFSIVTLRDVRARNNVPSDNESLEDWIDENSDQLF